jgi:peptide/nickel transport system substrate-binding protein
MEAMIRHLLSIFIRYVSFLSMGVAPILATLLLFYATGAVAQSTSPPAAGAGGEGLENPASGTPAHGIAMHGVPKYGHDFKCFAYANPRAPKGGRLSLANPGGGSSQSFDSLNPFIIKGDPAAGLAEADHRYVFESLMARSMDEPFSLYGLLAETIETPENRGYVRFDLRPEARFSDGSPVTVDDVIFSHALLRDHGRANHRSYYAKVTRVEKAGERGVIFMFAEGDREMPLIMGLMPVLPRAHYSPETFEKTSLDPPLGSGPYLVAKVDPGAGVTFKKNPAYWGEHLPVNCGFYNFDEIRHDYYRDASSMFEGFKKGIYDFRIEVSPSRWINEYNFPALLDGRVIKESFPLGVPSGMAALVFNTRRSIFSDRRVREALTLLFNFEWINKNLYGDLYVRSESYFDRSELSSHGVAADERERALLAPFPGEVRPDIMSGTFSQPRGDVGGVNRENRARALSLLQEAGYELRDGKLVEKASGQPFVFEILATTREQERLMLSFARSLESVGVEMRMRQVDFVQYERRKRSYDFDMIHNYWPASLSPGNEQGYRWSSAAADAGDTFNFAGVKSKAADAMITAVLAAKDRAEFVSAVHALDRALLSGDYVIPLFHLKNQWTVHWKRLEHPVEATLYGSQIDSWWLADGAREASTH